MTLQTLEEDLYEDNPHLRRSLLLTDEVISNA